MKHYYPKALTLLTCLLFGITVNAHNFEAQNSDGVTIYYNITSSSSKTVSVTYQGSSYSESVEYSGELIIPETVTYNDKDYSVTSIGSSAFRDCSNLTSVEIPNSVTNIGGAAFYGCTGLATVTIGNNVTSIGSSAFYGCTGLTSVSIGNSVTSIGSYAFQGCTGLTSVSIGNSVTTIDNFAFQGCTGMTSVSIGNSVTSIGGWAFEGCTALTKVNITDLEAWCKIDFSSNPLYYAKKLYLKDELLTDIKIPNTITEIKEDVFYYCTNLTSVEIPNSVTTIGSSAFDGCTGLTSVEIPNSVTTIGSSAFSNCDGLASVSIGNSVTSIGNYAFLSCDGLTSVEIPNSVTTIGSSAFSNCDGLASVSIGNSVTSIGESVFYSCKALTSVEIPNSVTTIGSSAFSNCDGLASVSIGNSVTSIGERVFYSCKALTSVEIPNSVTNIGDYAFEYCSSLTSITIPNSVTSIGNRAFDCTNLNICRIDAIVPPTVVSSPLPSSISLVLVPTGSKVAYTADAVWGTYTIIEEGSCDIEVTNDVAGELTKSIFNQTRKNLPNITSLIVHGTLDASDFEKINTSMTSLLHLDISDTDVTQIAAETFLDKTTLMTIKLPKGLKSIGNSAFEGCKVLSGELELPETLETIGNYTFQNCEMINGILNIPASVSSIGNYAFAGCSGLKHVDMSEAYLLTSLSNYIFNDCIALQTVKFPETMKSIGSYAFGDCSSLDNVVLPASLEVINTYAFSYCTNLISIDFSKCIALISLKNNAFYRCKGLKLLDLTDCTLLSAINNSTFSTCTALETVNFPSSLTTIGANAFANCTNLQHMSVPCTTPPAIENNANPFAGVDNIACVLSIPSGSIFDYYEANYWGGFVDVENKSDIQIEVTESENGNDESSKQPGCKIHFKKLIIGRIEPAELSLNNVKATLNEESVTIETGTALTASGQSIFVGNGDAVTFYFTPDEGMEIDKVIYNDEDVTSELVNNSYTTSAVNGMSSLQVILKNGTPTGVEDTFVEKIEAVEIARYDISGRLISAPIKGINFVKMSDGTVSKVIVK